MHAHFFRQLSFASLLLLFPLLALAHTALEKSTPAADATVKTPPASIELVFSGPVRLIKLQLMGGGQEMDTDFKPRSEPATTFSITTPGMHPGTFTVNWAAMGADGHTLTDSYSFVVDAEGAAP